jgi:hypothetical protein
MTGKAFGPSQIKRLSIAKAFDALRAASLKIVLVPDPEQLERMRKHMDEHCLPRQSNQSRANNHWRDRCPSQKMIDGVLGYLASTKGGLARLNAAARQARSNITRRDNATRRQRDEAATAA